MHRAVPRYPACSHHGPGTILQFSDDMASWDPISHAAIKEGLEPDLLICHVSTFRFYTQNHTWLIAGKMLAAKLTHTRSKNCRLLRSKQFASTQPYCFVTLACVLVKFSVFWKQHLRIWRVTLRWCSKFCQVHWRRLAARKGLFLRYLKAQVATFYMYLYVVLVYVYIITVILILDMFLMFLFFWYIQKKYMHHSCASDI